MTNENVSFPATNTQTKYYKEVAKSTTTTSTFTFTASSLQDIFLINTNANSGTYSVTVGGSPVESGSFDLTALPSYGAGFVGRAVVIGKSHVRFDSIHSSASVSITLSVSSGTLEIGNIIAGVAYWGGVSESEKWTKTNDLQAEFDALVNIYQYQDLLSLQNSKTAIVTAPNLVNDAGYKEGQLSYGRIELSGAQITTDDEYNRVKIKVI